VPQSDISDSRMRRFDPNVRIIDPQGGQSGDLVAFSQDGQQRLSNGRTFDYGGKIYLSRGDTLWSDRSAAQAQHSAGSASDGFQFLHECRCRGRRTFSLRTTPISPWRFICRVRRDGPRGRSVSLSCLDVQRRRAATAAGIRDPPRLRSADMNCSARAPYNIAAAFSPARLPYSRAEPQCCAPLSSEWPIATRP
jgi:Domain of unknown function (DUF1989)